MLKRAAALFVLVVVSGCGRTPASPSPSPGPPSPIVSYGGLWTGQIQITDCPGDRHCWLRIGQTEPLVLELKQTSTRYEGIVVMRYLTAEVHGDLDDSGALVLSGSTPSASDKDNRGTVEIGRLSLSGRPGAELRGSLTWSITPVPGSLSAEYGSGPRRYAADVVSLDRSGDAVLSYTGRWRGEYVVRTCTPVGWRFCLPDDVSDVSEFDMTLVQSGDTVAGQMKIMNFDIPVTGQVTGSRLSLEGAGEMRVSGGRSENRLTAFSGRLDDFGRLIATMEYASSYFRDAGDVLSTTYRSELWQVVSVRPD